MASLFVKRLVRFLNRHKMMEIYFGQYRWVRCAIGGVWEYHWINICGNSMWLKMTPPNVWPNYVEPFSHGTPIIEVWDR